MRPTEVINAEKLLRRGGRPHVDLQRPHNCTATLMQGAVNAITSLRLPQSKINACTGSRGTWSGSLHRRANRRKSDYV